MQKIRVTFRFWLVTMFFKSTWFGIIVHCINVGVWGVLVINSMPIYMKFGGAVFIDSTSRSMQAEWGLGELNGCAYILRSANLKEVHWQYFIIDRCYKNRFTYFIWAPLVLQNVQTKPTAAASVSFIFRIRYEYIPVKIKPWHCASVFSCSFDHVKYFFPVVMFRQKLGLFRVMFWNVVLCMVRSGVVLWMVYKNMMALNKAP